MYHNPGHLTNHKNNKNVKTKIETPGTSKDDIFLTYNKLLSESPTTHCPNACEESQVIKAFWKTRMVGACQIIRGRIFQRNEGILFIIYSFSKSFSVLCYKFIKSLLHVIRF